MTASLALPKRSPVPAALHAERQAFTTSRLLEFCTVTELTNLVGFEPDWWPVVAVKELIDNALDACEEAEITPEIIITVSKAAITVADNGPGIAAETVTSLLDYQTKTSSREAYVGPTRGARIPTATGLKHYAGSICGQGRNPTEIVMTAQCLHCNRNGKNDNNLH